MCATQHGTNPSPVRRQLEKALPPDTLPNGEGCVPNFYTGIQSTMWDMLSPRGEGCDLLVYGRINLEWENLNFGFRPPRRGVLRGPR